MSEEETYAEASKRLRDAFNELVGVVVDAVLWRGTCHVDETETFECVCDGIGHYGKRLTVHVMECSECGRTYEHVFGDYEYCPRCGRRIEVTDD